MATLVGMLDPTGFGIGDILIVVGGVIPEQDFEELRQAGAIDIYPPGTNIPQAAVRLLAEMRKVMDA